MTRNSLEEVHTVQEGADMGVQVDSKQDRVEVAGRAHTAVPDVACSTAGQVL